MDKKLIDGHIIFTSELTAGGWIIDAGCRHFRLEKKLTLLSSFYSHTNFKYLCLDPDPIIIPPKGVIFKPYALMTENGTVNYCGWSTGEGNYIYKDEKPHYATLDIEVQSRTIKSLMAEYGINQFELAKLDVEGAEYDILLSINFAFAKQVAVEFHQCLGHNNHGTHDDYIKKLMNSEFGNFYEIREFYESMPGMFEYNFVLKN